MNHHNAAKYFVENSRFELRYDPETESWFRRSPQPVVFPPTKVPRSEMINRVRHFCADLVMKIGPGDCDPFSLPFWKAVLETVECDPKIHIEKEAAAWKAI